MEVAPGYVHTVYWVYAWDRGERKKDLDTTPSVREAQQIARDMILDEGWHHVHIWYGDEEGPFTHLEPRFIASKRGRGVRFDT
jgi:hypothetical protein